MQGLSIMPVDGIPEVRPGDDLPRLVEGALARAGDSLRANDVVVFAQKVVSKSEGRIQRLAEVEPGEQARRIAAEHGKDARVIELVLRESRRIVRLVRGVLITETRHGFVCANAGVDRSNAGQPDTVVLLPVDPDASARALRAGLSALAGAPLAVVITDTFGRAWREGVTNVAIGSAGLVPLQSYLGRYDPEGYELRVTVIAVADEIAAACELVMGKLLRRPVAIVRGLDPELIGEGEARSYVRPPERDLFR